MTSENIDRTANVVILGAGPAGTAAAAQLGLLGVRDVVLVDRHDFPRDKTCGSGLSPRGIETLKELGVWEDVKAHSYPIHGMRLVTRGDRESWQSAGEQAAAVVCQRRILDHLLLKKALSRGVKFIPNFNATEVLKEGERVVGIKAADGTTVRAKYVLIAGGSHCRVGLPEQRPRRIIQAIMGWWDNVPFRAHHLEMIFDASIEPYYGWLFPESETRVNIGITYEERDGKQNARELFQRFLDKHYGERLKGATQVGGWKGHPVVWSYAIEKLTAPGRIVIGESGLMTHPATAEGIYQAMKSGMLGAGAIADILSGRRSETSAFSDYERRCKSQFLLSFWAGGVFRRVARTDALDWVVQASQVPAVKSTAARILASL
ncbi:MAG: NAD(P)/FAD-dependent oxidoreductase [Deltaproteobacteria bacterium]|nr:NAD(P)/FAD-dependent oxidoreductase [Deltaproteobacteria bacterium]